MSNTVMLRGESISQNGAGEWDLDFLDKAAGGDILYLDELFIDMSITALTQGAGSGATVKEIHDTISGVQIAADGNWGPNLLQGSDLAALHFHARGLPYPWTDGNGDASVAAGAGPVARRFQIPVFCPAWFGHEGNEFTPMNAVLQSGILIASFGNPDTDTTTFTFSAQLRAKCHREAKIKSAAPLHYMKQTLKSENASLPIKGPAMLVQHGLWKPSASRTAAEITTVNLKGGGEVHNLYDANNSFDPTFWPNPEVTAMRIVRHFADPVGGTNINYLPLFPAGSQGGRVSMSEMPTALGWNQILQGSLTISQYQNLTVYAEAQSDEEIERQWASIGASGKAADGIEATKNGNSNANDRLIPYLPRVFAEPSQVSKT